MTHTVLAWDPGPLESAWARLRWDGGPKVAFLGGGVVPFGVQHIDADGRHAGAGINEARQVLGVSAPVAGCQAGTVAVELAEGHAYAPFRVPGLLGTRGAGDALLLLALSFTGVPAWAVSAPTWRGDLVRSKTPTDAQIAVAVRGLVDGLASLPKKRGGKAYGAHVIDACGLAIFVLRKLGARLALTPDVEAELYRQTRADNGKAVAKSARTKESNGSRLRSAGVPLERIILPRGAR